MPPLPKRNLLDVLTHSTMVSQNPTREIWGWGPAESKQPWEFGRGAWHPPALLESPLLSLRMTPEAISPPFDGREN